MQIRDRIFGAPVSDTVIEIFRKLQEGVADVNPLDPVSDKIDTTAYLGDRTPFARLWTGVSVIGYNKKNEDYKEGDVWTENKKTWTIKNGIINKMHMSQINK